MLAAGWQVFATLEVTQPMQGYGDLEILPALSAERFLVMSGFRRLQQSKIRALRLAPCFTAIAVDAIDEPNRLGKQKLFELILDTYHLQPKEVLVVGDNPESEMAAGNRLGIQTVQMRIPANSATYSSGIRPFSPTETGHLFQRNLATYSSGIRPFNPPETGHPVQGKAATCHGGAKRVFLLLLRIGMRCQG